uniref:Uncharacterized protein n=1 Tax=Arundo donax TaxID=35708 RepID=A0A0A9A8G0_ARUDO
MCMIALELYIQMSLLVRSSLMNQVSKPLLYQNLRHKP